MMNIYIYREKKTIRLMMTGAWDKTPIYEAPIWRHLYIVYAVQSNPVFVIILWIIFFSLSLVIQHFVYIAFAQ